MSLLKYPTSFTGVTTTLDRLERRPLLQLWYNRQQSSIDAGPIQPINGHLQDRSWFISNRSRMDSTINCLNKILRKLQRKTVYQKTFQNTKFIQH